MKKTTILLALCILSLQGCYDFGNEVLKELETIHIGELDETIDVSLGESLVYDKLEVTSGLPVTYQWAYGKRKNGSSDKYAMESMEVISTDPQINYIFPKLGTYILRLRLDNSESIEYRYFTLNVNSGLDEGLLILNNNEDGESSLTFLRTLSADERERGEREIWDDVFSTMNSSQKIKHGTSMFLSSFTSGGIAYNHLAVSTADEDGTIYDINPKDMSLVMTVKMKADFDTWCCDFSGCQTATTGAYTFLRGANGHVYRYDLFTPFVMERTDLFNTAGPVTRSKNIIYTAQSTYIKAAFYTEELICQPDNSGTTNIIRMPQGYRIINFFTDRDVNRTYILLKGDSDYRIMYTTSSLSRLEDVARLEPGPVNMDENSIFCSSLNSNDVYYSYRGGIYRWNLTSRPAGSPVFTFPEGEEICDIATNFLGANASSASENILYVATFNETTGKGNLYLYEIATETLYKKYEGICGRTVKLLYKYRIS